MKKFLSMLMEPDYKQFYKLLKKLPGILAIGIFALTFIWSIVDAVAFTHEYDDYMYYGVMELESPVLVLLIWWAIGAVSAALAWFFSALGVSATATKTDAVVEINEKLKGE